MLTYRFSDFFVETQTQFQMKMAKSMTSFRPKLYPLPYLVFYFSGRTYSMEGDIYLFTIMGYCSCPLYTNLGSVYYDVRAAFVF